MDGPKPHSSKLFQRTHRYLYALQPSNAEPFCRRQPVVQQTRVVFRRKAADPSRLGGAVYTEPTHHRTCSTLQQTSQPTHTKMARKGGGAGESSKKAAGQSRKAEAAANKKAAEENKKAAAEDAEWSKGSKKANAKK